jgi:hypothetical protein
MFLSGRTYAFPMKRLPWDAKYRVSIRSNLTSSTLLTLPIRLLNIFRSRMIGQADCGPDDLASISHAHDTSRSERDSLDPLLLQYVPVLSNPSPVQVPIFRNVPPVVTIEASIGHAKRTAATQSQLPCSLLYHKQICRSERDGLIAL